MSNPYAISRKHDGGKPWNVTKLSLQVTVVTWHMRQSYKMYITILVLSKFILKILFYNLNSISNNQNVSQSMSKFWVILLHFTRRVDNFVVTGSTAWKWQHWLLLHLYQHGLTLIPAWISNYTHYNRWNGITYPFLNFNGCAVEVKELINNSIPHFVKDVIRNVSMLGLKLNHVSKRGHWNVLQQIVMWRRFSPKRNKTWKNNYLCHGYSH